MLQQEQLLLPIQKHIILQNMESKTMELHKLGTSSCFLQSLEHKNAPMNACNSN